MQVHLLAALLTATDCAFASVRNRRTITDDTPFNLQLQVPGTTADGKLVQAASDGFVEGLTIQGATGCTANSATFITKVGKLFLYTPAGTTQEVFIENTSTGQGVLQYGTTPDGPPTSQGAETVGWAISGTGEMTFSNLGLVVCSPPVGSHGPKWTIGLHSGGPSRVIGCSKASWKAIPAATAQRCIYSFTKTP